MYISCLALHRYKALPRVKFSSVAIFRVQAEYLSITGEVTAGSESAHTHCHAAVFTSVVKRKTRPNRKYVSVSCTRSQLGIIILEKWNSIFVCTELLTSHYYMYNNLVCKTDWLQNAKWLPQVMLEANWNHFLIKRTSHLESLGRTPRRSPRLNKDITVTHTETPKRGLKRKLIDNISSPTASIVPTKSNILFLKSLKLSVHY